MAFAYVNLITIASAFYAFRESTWSGKVIVGVLVVCSVIAWTIMVSKWVELDRAEKSSKMFVNAFRKEGHPISLFLKRQRYPESPIYKMYESACLTLGGELEARGVDEGELFMGSVGQPEKQISQLQLEAVRSNTERNVADQALLLESNMGMLATAVSASPFLGLLGTVWGVMDAFGGMAVKGSATLSAVAPGIAGALLTTVIGLLVALPSAIGYNMLTDKIRRLTVAIDNFGQEYVSNVQRIFVRDQG